MGVKGGIKVIRSGETEVYDVRGDPGEIENLAAEVEARPRACGAIREYPIDPLSGAAQDPQTEP